MSAWWLLPAALVGFVFGAWTVLSLLRVCADEQRTQDWEEEHGA